MMFNIPADRAVLEELPEVADVHEEGAGLVLKRECCLLFHCCYYFHGYYHE